MLATIDAGVPINNLTVGVQDDCRPEPLRDERRRGRSAVQAGVQPHRLAIDRIVVHGQSGITLSQHAIAVRDGLLGADQIVAGHVRLADRIHPVELRRFGVVHVGAIFFAFARNVGVVNNPRRQQHQNFGSRHALGFVPKQRSGERQAAEERDLRRVGHQFFAHQTTDDDRATIGAHDVRRHFGQRFVRQRKAPFNEDFARRKFRVNFHPDQTVARNEGPQAQLRADVEKLDVLRREGLRDGRADVTETLADQDLGLLFV